MAFGSTISRPPPTQGGDLGWLGVMLSLERDRLVAQVAAMRAATGAAAVVRMEARPVRRKCGAAAR